MPDKKPKLKGLGGIRRTRVAVSQENPVKVGPLVEGDRLPLLIEPSHAGVDLLSWAAGQRDFLEQKLAEHGGILFRNFPIDDVQLFEKLTEAVSSELLDYRERSSPRSRVQGNVYTSTDYPADQPIFLHNENSYQYTWPMKIFFYCHIAAEEGGETPIADCRKVYGRIDPEIRRRFAEKKWSVIRNYGEGVGLGWETVFQTSDKAAVEEHCRKNGIDFEWKGGERLRTRAVRPALVEHPTTGEKVWFNHATFFHISTLTAEVREPLLSRFAAEDLPSNTAYGDGTPIEPEVLDHLRDAYRQETVLFPWQKGDILMLDNMMVAHGRSPFKGARKILVGMAEPLNWSQLEERSRVAVHV